MLNIKCFGMYYQVFGITLSNNYSILFNTLQLVFLVLHQFLSSIAYLQFCCSNWFLGKCLRPLIMNRLYTVTVGSYNSTYDNKQYHLQQYLSLECMNKMPMSCQVCSDYRLKKSQTEDTSILVISVYHYIYYLFTIGKH